MRARYRNLHSTRGWLKLAVTLAVMLIGAVVGPRVYQRSAAPRDNRDALPTTTAEAPAMPSAADAEGVVRVERAVDGDTLKLADGTRVRLIGVNAPETVKPHAPVEPWGPEASAFTKHFVAAGEVRLEFDKTRKDQYGRTLAYVWVGSRMLNEELVRAGLARVEYQYSFSRRMKDRFAAAELEARRAHVGIWSK